MTAPPVHLYTGSATVFLERVGVGLRERHGIDAITLATESQFASEIEQVEVLIAAGPPPGSWNRARQLRVIQAPGAGVDRILPAEGLDERVVVANAAGTSAPAIAEFTLATLFTLFKRLPAARDLQVERRWEAPSEPVMVDQSTITVAGTGAIGRAVASRLTALGARVIGVRRRPEPMAPFDEVVGIEDLRTAVAASNAVVIALPMVAGLERLFDESMLRAMPAGAVLINVARGRLVDEPALVRCLEDEHLSGAALDVTTIEPLPAASPLWTAPNLLLTPHISWRSDSYLDRVVDLIADNVARHRSGRPLQNVVDRHLGYAVDTAPLIPG